MEFDLICDALVIRDTRGQEKRVALAPQSVAHFYACTMGALRALGIDVRIDPMPCELPEAVPFHSDNVERSYDGQTARAYWRALV